ncbi:MAG: hypothetical protein MZU91_12985 [Desulfosudis oleivorans]|nr:hypothetical protein [Desulfosudis oleivorans]
MEDTPALGHFEPVVALAGAARRWLDHDAVSSPAARWLAPLAQALLPLAGVAQILPGPGLLNVLQEAERGTQAALDQTTGHLPAESQARAIGERLREWLRAATADLIDANGLQVRTSPASLVAGTFAEFSVEVENPGALPLRNVRVETQPDWGIAELPYPAERGAFPIHLRGDVPGQGGDLSCCACYGGHVPCRDRWSTVRSNSPSAWPSPSRRPAPSPAELGGSLHVTGSPLEPQHGHSVFYGREELIGKISRQIATHGNVVLLEGNRRAGKTSILKHLEGAIRDPGLASGLPQPARGRRCLAGRRGAHGRGVPRDCPQRGHGADQIRH